MKGFGKSGKLAAVFLAAALLVSGSARASGEWMGFAADSVPEQGWTVQEYTGTVRITFLGDCTLGSTEEIRNAYRGFARTVERNGYAYPFRNLAALTASDDLTVTNLEGVLSDRKDLKKEDKTYNFLGKTAYTEILKEGSVECVTLANNHSRDYGAAGYRDTAQALEKAGVAWFGTDRMAVWRNEDGLMIGFLGVSGSLSGDRYKAYRAQMQILKSMGCAAVVTVMHTGTEYEYKPDGYQEQVVSRAVSCGTDLVVGHHPHVVQGWEIRDGVPVVYSLGNCVFGGNTNPRDHDALAVQADLAFEEGVLAGITLRFYPISVSGEESFNDYSPVFLTGKDAVRVLRKMEESTGNPTGAFEEGEGAAVTVPAP